MKNLSWKIVISLFCIMLISLSASAAPQYGGPPPGGDPDAKEDAISIAMGVVKIESAKLTYVSGADTFSSDILELTVTNPKEGAIRQLIVFGGHPDFNTLSHLAKGDQVRFIFSTTMEGGPIAWQMWNLPAGYLRLGKGPAQRALVLRAQAEADQIAEVGQWRVRTLVQTPGSRKSRLVVLIQNGTGGNAQFTVDPSHRQYGFYQLLSPYEWTTVGMSRTAQSMGAPGSLNPLDWIRAEGPGKG